MTVNFTTVSVKYFNFLLFSIFILESVEVINSFWKSIVNFYQTHLTRKSRNFKLV